MKTPKLNSQSVVCVGRVPEFIKHAAEYFVELLSLQEFKIHIHHATLKTINRHMRESGYEGLSNQDRAAVIIDSKYLMAHVYILAPLRPDLNALATLAHEFIHIWMRHKMLNRVKDEVVNLEFDVLSEQAFDGRMLNIEERSVEHFINVLDKLGVFQQLATYLKISGNST